MDPRSVLAALRREGLASVMVEGGAEVLGSFLAARLVDEVALFRAPLLLGGRRSLSAFGGPDPKALGRALRLEPVPERAGLSPGPGRRSSSAGARSAKMLPPGRRRAWKA
jgi:riboflavin biosynthesis pyrimidine reductase